MNGIQPKIYMVPPGLRYKIEEFEAHFAVAKGAPIMICGPSGVGKSLFLHLFEKLFREKERAERTVATVNCSHFAGDIARSELFGHVKGSFTGAIHEKEGWLEKADGGALILEEVGDLPLETQAMLLSFVETGKYHKVGSAETETSNVQIVAATNREASLREDFRHRFFPFYVPPVCRRRGDILYYLAFIFPNLIPSLTSWEVLSLLVHNWPGNVREVEKTGRILQKRKLLLRKDHAFEIFEEARKEVSSGRFSLEDEVLKRNRVHRLFKELEENGIHVDLLHTLLNDFKLGINVKKNDRFFENPHLLLDAFDCVRDERLNVVLFQEVEPFKETYRGLQLFCFLFCLDANGSGNLLDGMDEWIGSGVHPGARFLDSKIEHLNLAGSIRNYLEKKRGKKEQDIVLMTRHELLTQYYTGLLEMEGGNRTAAAKKAGLKYTTFCAQLKKYNIL